MLVLQLIGGRLCDGVITELDDYTAYNYYLASITERVGEMEFSSIELVAVPAELIGDDDARHCIAMNWRDSAPDDYDDDTGGYWVDGWAITCLPSFSAPLTPAEVALWRAAKVLERF